MIISLDYDDTFTKDPEAWIAFASIMSARGHTIYGVTMRYPRESSDIDERYTIICDRIYFTSRRAKLSYLRENNIHVDVWVDDSPHWLVRDALQ